MPLAPGLYESVLTDELRAVVDTIRDRVALDALSADAAPHALARHVHDRLVRALLELPEEDRIESQIALTNALLDVIMRLARDSGVIDGDRLTLPAAVLMQVAEVGGLGDGNTPRPSLSLGQSDLLVNGPRDLRLGDEIRRELPSADRVDVLVSFLKWTGFRVIRPELTRLLARRPGCVRVLTTSYMGATEPEAVEALIELGAEVRVSYDTRRTRLHAKAWLFHRESGFSTGLVGSSNLSQAALLDGCEWNVRLTAVDNRVILDKLHVTFDQYWADPEFEAYDRARLTAGSSRRDEERDALAQVGQLRAHPYQEAVLDALALERARGHARNLVVAATGTGKTVMAALDYARLRGSLPRSRLLFVAHREEILQQSLATFRVAVRDGHFGELLVGRHRPVLGEHVFASIQSLHADRIATLDPEHYDVVVVDEFHHAESKSYRDLLERLRPRVLLGLTATPERADGRSILGWFDSRLAANLRLWDALDLGLLAPFQYFGVYDGTDLTAVDFRAGRYDVEALERVYTADDLRTKAVLRAVGVYVRRPSQMRALGFCVSVQHAEYAAESFRRAGFGAVAVHGDSAEDERKGAIRALQDGRVQVVFTVDLFNEGVDIPSVDTVLFLRPTESATVFLQQLGRGLRHHAGKSCLTVLDFVGNAHRRFRFDTRYKAILGGGTRSEVRSAIEEGFPRLPAGCDIRLEREAQQVILRNVSAQLDDRWSSLIADLRATGDVGVRGFLSRADLELGDLYFRATRSYTALLHASGLRAGPPPGGEALQALPRLLHIDDEVRLTTWREWLRSDRPPTSQGASPLVWMLFAALGFARRPVAEVDTALAMVWETADLRAELAALLDELDDQRRRPTYADCALPFRTHATYSRDEVMAGLLQVRGGQLLRTQGGVFFEKSSRSDVFFVTLVKDERHFTPTTQYNDYPISPTRFHWESQSVTRAESDTGRRYRGLSGQAGSTLLFVRQRKHDSRGLTMPYLFLGPARFVSSEGERPMRIVWELERPMPGAFFAEAKVAAG